MLQYPNILKIKDKFWINPGHVSYSTEPNFLYIFLSHNFNLKEVPPRDLRHDRPDGPQPPRRRRHHTGIWKLNDSKNIWPKVGPVLGPFFEATLQCGDVNRICAG